MLTRIHFSTYDTYTDRPGMPVITKVFPFYSPTFKQLLVSFVLFYCSFFLYFDFHYLTPTASEWPIPHDL